MPQGEWLARLGIHERAAALRRHADAPPTRGHRFGARRLAGDAAESAGASMARLFKALAVTAPGLGVPPGFEAAAA